MSTGSRVNVPVDPKKRDRDVDNKLRLYGIYNAFANGKLPSNKQIDVALSSFADHKKLKNPNDKLSPEGRALLEDFRNVIEDAKRLILAKNHDQAIQELIWNSSQLGQKGGPEQAGAPNAPVDKEATSRDMERGMEGLRTLGQLIITNGQFRKLLNDAVILLRDVAGDAATKAASRISPSEDQLRQIDNPAPDHQWHDAPNLSKDKLKQRLLKKTNENKPIDRGELRDVAQTANQTADPYSSRNPADTAGRAADDQRYGTQSGFDARQGVRAGFNELQNHVDEAAPEEYKDRAREYRERTKRFLENKMPQDRREQTIWRLKKMVVEIQSHQDYQQAIDALLQLAETYTGHGRNLAGQGAGTVKGARQDSHLRSAEQNLRVILERFANNTSADDLFEAIDGIYRDADRDPELKEWFRSVNSYVRRCLKEEGYILQPQSSSEYDKLYDHGSFLLRNRYRDHTDRLMDEVRFMGDQFSADPDNKRFVDSLTKLFNDLGTDDDGKPAFKKHLLKDVTEIILPEVFESIRYVPIPRIEYSDPKIDAVIDNLVIESDNLMPNVLEVGNDSYFRFDRKSVSNKRKQEVMVSASGIQCDMRDVSYYIQRKQGFPSLTDLGVADIFLGGDGFSFKLKLSTADKHDRANFFKVDNVKVSVKHMNVKLKQSKHKLLFGIFKGLLLKIMKPAITKVLEQQIRNSFRDLDALAYRIYLEQEKVEKRLKENPDPENAQNIYNRYYEATQKVLMARKKQAEKKVQDKHTNMAVTTQDSIFKDIKLPGGISTKATQYKEESVKGDKWESPIFSIGTAPETTGLQPARVTRKSPHAQRRTLRDRDANSSVGGYSRDSGFLDQEGFAGFDTGRKDDGQHPANPVTLNTDNNKAYGRYTAAQPDLTAGVYGHV